VANSLGGGSFPDTRRYSANSVALLASHAEILRFIAHKIRHSAALLILPALHIGGNFHISANFNKVRN
jgi:hypothetical protein